MNPRNVLVCLAALVLAGNSIAPAQDWPQWLGPHRDAKASAFRAPASWPKQLTQKWKVVVGEGVATPALASDRLYVFSRQDGFEVLRCLQAADGKEVWQDKYESLGADGPAGRFSGPRSSPAVADGKVVTLGVRGMVSCLEAATGKVLWRKDEFHAYPRFFPSSSPVIVSGLAIAQLGGRENGALVAYDLNSGAEKWRWNGPSPAYASPSLLQIGDSRLILAQTESKLVAVNATDGSLAWESGGALPDIESGYRAATPVVEGQTFLMAGRGLRSVQLASEGGKIVARELWANPDITVEFSTPIPKNDRIYGLTANNELFCLDAKDGHEIWRAQFPPSPDANRAALRDPNPTRTVPSTFLGQADPNEPRPRRGQGQGQGRPGGPPGGGGGGRRGGGGGGYGSLVDAGSVLLALTPDSRLLVIDPSTPALKVRASYKVGENPTHAYPIASGNRIFIKDVDSMILWTVD